MSGNAAELAGWDPSQTPLEALGGAPPNAAQVLGVPRPVPAPAPTPGVRMVLAGGSPGFATRAPPAQASPLPSTPVAPGASAPTGSVYDQARLTRRHGENASQDQNAQNPHSSAGGVEQIIDGTWRTLMHRHHPEIAGRVSDAELMAMKKSRPDLAHEMADRYDQENGALIQRAGLPLTPQAINAAYRLGPGGAMAALRAAQANPNAPLAQVVPTANTPGNGDIAGLTVGQFLANPYPGRSGSGGASAVGMAALSPQDRAKFGESATQANAILTRLMEASQKGSERLDQMMKDHKPFVPASQPTPPDPDPLKAFGSAAGIFAMFASMFSKTPAIAAMNGMASAIQGARDHDWTKYEAGYKAWKDGTEFALRAHEAESRDIQEALNMLTTNATVGASMLNATLAARNDQVMGPLLANQEYERIHQIQQQRDAAAQTMRTTQEAAQLDSQISFAEQQLLAARNSGDPGKVEAAQQQLNILNKMKEDRVRAQQGGRYDSTNRNADMAMIQRYMAEHPEASFTDAAKWLQEQRRGTPQSTQDDHRYKVDKQFESGQNRIAATERGQDIHHEDTVAAQAGRDRHNQEMEKLRAATANSNTLAPENYDFIAQRMWAGDRSASMGWGFVKGAKVGIEQALERNIPPGMSRQEAARELALRNAEYTGIQRAEATIGTRAGAVGMAGAEIKPFSIALHDAAARVNPSDYPTLNSVMNAVSSGTGGTQVRELYVAVAALKTAYAQLLARSGVTTVDAFKRSDEVLNNTLSLAQIDAVISQIEVELAGATAAPGAARREIREGFGAPSQPQPPGPRPAPFQDPASQQGRPAQGAPADAPEVTREEYDRLPPGAHYRLPGSSDIRTKP